MGQSFSKRFPDWETGPIKQRWEQYADEVFGKRSTKLTPGDRRLNNGEQADHDEEIDPAVVEAVKRKRRTGLDLEMDENDEPIVPDPVNVRGADRETFIRHFVTHYYRKLFFFLKICGRRGSAKNDRPFLYRRRIKKQKRQSPMGSAYNKAGLVH